MRLRKLLTISILVVLLASPFVAFIERDNIYDWYRLYNYTAPDKVVQLASDTTMLPSLRRLFYVYYPELEDKTSFNQHCRTDELTIVLGCFVEHKGIYLLKVDDARLDGVEQVTAAHEVLHAAYSRLSKGEKAKVDGMTSAAYLALDDARVKANIELYRKKDPSVVPNELHSILGTEVQKLPQDLEDYYKKYFSDRSKVVAFSEQYEQAFTERKKQVQAYDAELTSLKKQIEDLQTSLSSQSAALQAQRIQMDGYQSSNQISAYNAAVPGYNSKVGKYNRDVDNLSGLIDRYNDIVPKRNAIASEESDLAKAIDSRASVPARQ